MPNIYNLGHEGAGRYNPASNERRGSGRQAES